MNWTKQRLGFKSTFRQWTLKELQKVGFGEMILKLVKYSFKKHCPCAEEKSLLNNYF